jgi:hypothetical protein
MLHHANYSSFFFCSPFWGAKVKERRGYLMDKHTLEEYMNHIMDTVDSLADNQMQFNDILVLLQEKKISLDTFKAILDLIRAAE